MTDSSVDLVFIPAPGMGHLVSAVEMAKLLLLQQNNLSISVLIIKLPFESHVNSYIDSLLSSTNNYGSRLKLVQLSQDLPDLSEHANKVTFFRLFLQSHKPSVRGSIKEIMDSGSPRIAGFVVDMFCADMVDVANEFGIPTYVFYTSGAAFLGLHLHLQSLRDDNSIDVTEFKDSDPDLCVSTFSKPFPAKLLPAVAVDKAGGSTMFLDMVKRTRETKGILINTFFELEPHAVKALLEDGTVPPVYPVGPILNLKSDKSRESEKEIITWLDDQLDSSVVFLCFGSGGSFPEPQVKEIARALERSGHRFLWALRKPPGKVSRYPTDYNNFEEVLPEGFLERTKSIGKVIGWAPQAVVLAHPAVGGFVSHCGWNSTLESVWFGVPMATWPMYAEQQANAFELVNEIGIGVEVKMDYKRDDIIEIPNVDTVSAEEIETAITRLMDNSAANTARIKSKELKEKSRNTLEEGGSSLTFIERFYDLVMNNLK